MTMIKKILDYVREGVWVKKEEEYRTRTARWAARQFKVLIYMIRGSGEHSLGMASAAMTFYTLMSVVPIVAIIFAVVKGFGGEKAFQEFLYEKIPQHTQVIDYILSFVNNLLQRTKGGLIAAVSFVVLVWAVMQVFGSLEKSFNNIWEVRKSRTVARKLTDYMMVVLVAPILWIAANGIGIYIKSQLSFVPSVFLEALYGLASLVVMWVLFIFIYRVMPNTKVKMRSAISAGIIAGTIFALFQVIYVYAQTRMTSYNAIYGSFAALPLFLIWVQISWMILLYGSELSFAYQNISKYEQERESMHMSYDHRMKVLVSTMLVTIRHFVAQQGPVSSEVVAAELNMPIRIVRDVMFDLERAGLVSAVQNRDDEKINLYIPARDIHTITIFDVIDGVEQSGSVDFDFETNDQLRHISEVIDRMREDNFRSSRNILLMDIA